MMICASIQCIYIWKYKNTLNDTKKWYIDKLMYVVIVYIHQSIKHGMVMALKHIFFPNMDKWSHVW